MKNSAKYHIGLVIFPGMTQLDITGPHQIFALMPNTCVHLLWKSLQPVTSNEGMTILPTTTFEIVHHLMFCAFLVVLWDRWR